MRSDKRKVVIVGTGMVGMSYAYALINQSVCNELVLIDIDKRRAEGEAMDLNHGMVFAQSAMSISAGDYSDCADADIVVICAGVAQNPGETRLDLLQRNADVMKTIIDPVLKSGFDGIFLMASNPVDIMTRIVFDLSGFPPHKVIGSGTTLDTARLRYLMGRYFDVDSRNIHAYVIGEHGDSEFVPWSQAMLATKPVLNVCRDNSHEYSIDELYPIADEVKNSAEKIIAAKKATYYGIGMSLVRITKAIFGNENSVLTVSSQLNGHYGIKDVFLGLPAYVNRDGVRRILNLELTEEEISKLRSSAETLDSFYKKLNLNK